MPRRVAFLHTSPVHVATFDALAAAHGLGTTHLVTESLLVMARAESLSEDVRAAVRAEVERAPLATPLVCTCSTIGGVAEEVGRDLGRVVLRVDRPMARQAVTMPPGRPGGPTRIGVVAALDSTLDPTRALLMECADAAHRDVSIVETLAAQAWPLFESGDHAAYLTCVASAAREVGDDVDVVVLAQASMAAVADLLGDLAVPVLSSPACLAATWSGQGASLEP